MAGVSALLRSAQATQKKVRTQEDQLVAFEWENSAQTYEDFVSYSKYLDDRAQKAGDVSDQLTYQNKIRSARRSYTSNELQRQQIQIMEGAATTQDKMDLVRSLHSQAVENGDYNLAQNLYSQYDALSIKLQNEQEAAMKQYESTLKSGQASADKAIAKLKNDLEKGVDDVTLPNGHTVTPLAAIAQNFQQTGDTVGTMKAAQETLEAIKGVIIDEYQSATSQDQIDKLEEKYGAGLADIEKTITYNANGTKLTAQDVTNVIANDQLNNPVYGIKAVRNEATGQNEFKLQKNNIDSLDYARQIDEQGNEYYTPVSIRTDQEKLMFGQSDQGRGLSTQITNEGAVIGDKGQTMLGSQTVKRDESQTIANRLKNLGIIAKQNGTTLSIKLPGENVEREAAIQPDGSLRYFSDDGQLIELGTVDRNLGTDALPQILRAGEQRAVSPDEASDFGLDSKFGGALSVESAQGKRYRDSILGNSRINEIAPNDLRKGINIANDFSGRGGVFSSSLLQSAQFTQKTAQQEQQKQQMLQAQQQAAQLALQSTNNFDLNQTPVQQLANNGVLKRQLTVAAPTPQQRIYVAPTPYVPITSTSVAKPSTYISGVGVAAPPKAYVGR